MITKTYFDDKLSNLNRKSIKNKEDHLLVQNELEKLKTFDLSNFIGKNYFDEDGKQNYLVFPPIFRYFKVIVVANVTNYVLSWKSKGLSDETVKPPSTSNNNLTPTIRFYYQRKIRVEFAGSSLKQDKITFNHGK